MSKYDPLRRYLASRQAAENPMTFADVERVLGFPLPDSARRHPAWWSNNTGTHVGVRAWRDAGFKASRVDIGRERVTFVRETPPEGSAIIAEGVGEDSATFTFDKLSPTARRMVEDCMDETGLDSAGAVAAILEASALARRRRLLDDMPLARMPDGHDSTQLIREDRDGR